MIDLAYVQKKDGEFINETAYNFWYGCRLLGIQTVSYTAEEIDTIELRKDTLVHGWIGCVRKAFKRLGVPAPSLDGAPPKDIESFYGRRMWTTTMGEVRKLMDTDTRVFIKPLHAQKAFNGHVTSGAVSDLIQTAGFDDEFEVFASDPVEFISEHRLFVHNGLIVGCKNYRGDFTKLPDFQVATDVVLAFKNQPVAFSLDLGVTSDGQTLIVEVNDFFALGSYGLPAIPYAQAVIDRWGQIVGL